MDVDEDMFHRDGYVVVDGTIAPGLMGELRAAAERATSVARAGKWLHGIRTCATPFPPYDQDASNDVWGVHMLLHPDLGEPAFGAWYGSMALRQVCATLLGVSPDRLQMELLNMLVNPTHTHTSLPWHRDMLASDLTDAEEAAALAESLSDSSIASGLQWNTALHDDACFVLVPGTHARVRTAREREVTTRSPHADLPGQKVLALRAGQTVFYNPNLLHRGVYDPGSKRATLHCSVGAADRGAGRAANIMHVLGRDRPLAHTQARFVACVEASGEEGLRGMHRNLLRSLAEAKRLGLLTTDAEDRRIQAYKKQVAQVAQAVEQGESRGGGRRRWGEGEGKPAGRGRLLVFSAASMGVLLLALRWRGGDR
jgi:hypothetical protein